MKRAIWIWSIALLVILGCGGGANNSTIAPDPLVGFINVSSNSVAMDALVNDAQIGNNVAFRSPSPSAAGALTFQSFEPGLYDVSVVEDSDPSTQAIETAQIDRDKAYILFGSGLVTPPNDEFEKRLRPVILEIDRSKPNGDQARIIVFHAYNRSLGFETPQIDFQNPGDTPDFRETNIGANSARVLSVPSGAQTFVARRSGTEFELTPQVTFTFEAGKLYVAIVGGIEGGAGSTGPAITFQQIQTK